MHHHQRFAHCSPQSNSSISAKLTATTSAAAVIDIDIIFYGERKVNRKNLILPHINFANRPFVIVPINELDKKMKRKLTKKFKKFLIHTNILTKISDNIVQKVS